jgi:hypothetical protein
MEETTAYELSEKSRSFLSHDEMHDEAPSLLFSSQGARNCAFCLLSLRIVCIVLHQVERPHFRVSSCTLLSKEFQICNQ